MCIFAFFYCFFVVFLYVVFFSEWLISVSCVGKCVSMLLLVGVFELSGFRFSGRGGTAGGKFWREIYAENVTDFQLICIKTLYIIPRKMCGKILLLSFIFY